MTLLFSFLVAVFLTSVLVPPLMRLAPRLHLMDAPNERKIHKNLVPLCGGLAIAGGALVPVLMWGRLEQGLGLALAAAMLILLVGAIDDARPLNYRWRLIAQSCAVVLILVGGVRFGALPLLGLDWAPWWLAIPATALFVLACTNAVNLADGMDGLAGGLAIPSLLAIALLAYQGTGGTVMVACAALIGAVLGFLRFNTHPASVFLGDAGSTFLGFTTAVLAILLVERCHTALNPGIVALLMGVPLLDILYAVVRRLATGQSPFKADKRHLHHQLLALGLSQTQVVAALYSLQGFMVLTAILLRYETDSVVLGAFVLIALVVIVPLASFSSTRPVPQPATTAGPAPTSENGTERRNLWLRSLTWLPDASLKAAKLGVAGFIVLGALAPAVVPRDISVVAVCTVGLWLAARILMPRTSATLHRLLIYTASSFATYTVVAAAADRPFLGWSVAVYLMAVAAVLIVAIRVTRRELFRVTPQDLLVLFLAVAVPNLSGQAVAQYHLREMIAVLIVLFYATEFVLAKDSGTRLGLNVAALLSLCLIGIRGFI